MIKAHLKEAIDLKNQCFAYKNWEGHAYWWEKIIFLEALLDLYKE